MFGIDRITDNSFRMETVVALQRLLQIPDNRGNYLLSIAVENLKEVMQSFHRNRASLEVVGINHPDGAAVANHRGGAKVGVTDANVYLGIDDETFTAWNTMKIDESNNEEEGDWVSDNDSGHLSQEWEPEPEVPFLWL
ncbi:hypothetical protein C8J56DRAFT_903951 [Mycena floridula]|nr:hypothetical protein C8J56DRAFT_903951 [Mycena floridula]